MSDTSPSSAPALRRFPGWELDLDRRELRVGGVVARVGGRAFDVLQALTEQPERLLSKDELLARAWPGLMVEENNLTVQVSALRKALGPDVIVNVVGRGYRLAVRELSLSLALSSSPAPPQQAAKIPMRPGAPALLGRQADLGVLQRLLDTHALVSLVGPGGVGKTALARVVEDIRSKAGDDVRWIDLTAAHDGGALLPFILTHLGCMAEAGPHEEADLSIALHRFRALVVLDNAETFAETLALVMARLLQAAPGITWLVTSQVPLHLAQEQVLRIAPLPLPGADTQLDGIAASAALQLLSQAIRRGDPEFMLSRDNLGPAIDLCAALDGLPLALELAAGQAAVMGLPAVLRQLERRRTVRASAADRPERQRSLDATYAWSCGLLPAQARRVFAALAAFQGGVSEPLMETLVAALFELPQDEAAPRAFELLRMLVDRSLVHKVPATRHGPTRYRLLESARAYAMQLETPHGSAAHGEIHARLMAAWFADAFEQLGMRNDQAWIGRYGDERTNLQQALKFVCSQDAPDLLASLVEASSMVDLVLQAPCEVVRLPIAQSQLRAAAPLRRARAAVHYGWAHFMDGDRQLGEHWCAAALADFQALGDGAGEYLATMRLLRVLHVQAGASDRTRALWERLQALDMQQPPLRWRLLAGSAVSLLYADGPPLPRLRQTQLLARQAGFSSIDAACTCNMTDALMVDGEFEQVQQQAEAALAAALPWVRVRAMLRHNLALACARLGKLDDARLHCKEVLRALPAAAHMVLDILAQVALQEHRPEAAALMAGCAARVKRERSRRPEAAELALIRDNHEALKAAWGETELSRLLDVGAQLDLSALLDQELAVD
jgi:predicted ATPase/DNA-binding winged helix-turn-helix (wHTH) protein